jgi:hypothetical protein
MFNHQHANVILNSIIFRNSYFYISKNFNLNYFIVKYNISYINIYTSQARNEKENIYF